LVNNGANVQAISNKGESALNAARYEELERQREEESRRKRRELERQQEEKSRRKRRELERQRRELERQQEDESRRKRRELETQQEEESRRKQQELERQRRELEEQTGRQRKGFFSWILGYFKPKQQLCSVFLSHTGADSDAAAFAGFLASKLRDKYNIDAFLDSETLETGDTWRQKIEDSAKGCKVFVAILSKHYFERFWCLHELDLAFRHNVSVVPVYIEADLNIPKAEAGSIPEPFKSIEENLNVPKAESEIFHEPLTSIEENLNVSIEDDIDLKNDLDYIASMYYRDVLPSLDGITRDDRDVLPSLDDITRDITLQDSLDNNNDTRTTSLGESVMGIAKAEDVSFVDKVKEMLSQRNCKEEPSVVVHRWLANITSLDAIHGKRNYSKHKHWMKHFCDEVADFVHKQIMK